MGFMGSALSMGLGGLGHGMAELGNKYIDEALAEQRAQVIADIQRQSAITQAMEIDKYTNSPERRANMRALARDDAAAAAEAELAAQLARATNKPLQDALVGNVARTKRAEAENTAHQVIPGAEVIIGPGKNLRPTSQEVQGELYREGFKGKGGLDNLSDAGKAEFKGLSERLRELEKTIDKGLGERTLSDQPTDSNGKPNPGYAEYLSLLKRQQETQIQQLRLLVREKVKNGYDDAQSVLNSSPTMDEIRRSADLAKRIGGEYATDFLRAVKPTLEHPDNQGTEQERAARLASKTEGVTTAESTVGGKKRRTVYEAGQEQVGPPDIPVRSAAAGGPAAPVQPQNWHPDRSLAGRARMAEEAAARQKIEEEQQKQEAQRVFNDIGNDVNAAFKLQSSALFKYLTKQQQLTIHNLVNYGTR